ncbi:hypothetical protein NTE_02691 [Candidatus Nitrososphaera evergladensis SR1]|uniref:Uncharacterized protein n=1 Tax=Candidatus Nitrososphaera evergladensis SR1 TaxID=1459636 RepID=A0A075MUE8_9ARCH|nr:hypothetical protein [Candidatus Nitrososphaera evergladensis]AIF84733.1 hypothetical protein NTE_02691 [Candidatus Nitrososphaera evergladensis SR1]
MTKGSKPDARTQKSGIKIIIIAAIAVIAAGITAAAASGAIQPPNAPMASTNNDKPMVMHIHPKLSLLVGGQETQVPQNIGIDKTLWNDHSLDSFGMQGMAPLHTHDTSGTIHVESNEQRDYTLGQLLDIWGVMSDSKYAGKEVKVIADGSPVPDFKNLVLKDGQEIRLEVS